MSHRAGVRVIEGHTSLAIFYVPKRNPIVLANVGIDLHYMKVVYAKNAKKHEVIRGIEKNQGV